MSLGENSNINNQATYSDNVPLPHVGHAQFAINSSVLSLPYKPCQLGNPKSWDGYTNPISMFGQTLSQEINVNNIKILLSHISNFISNRELKNNKEKDISFLKDFSQITFDFVATVFKSGWN